MSTSKFNPEIFPSNKRSKEEYRRSLMSMVTVSVVVVVIGLIFWSQNKTVTEEQVPVVESTPQDQVKVTLTTEEAQKKADQMENAREEQVRLTKAQAALKAQQMKALSQ